MKKSQKKVRRKQIYRNDCMKTKRDVYNLIADIHNFHELCKVSRRLERSYARGVKNGFTCSWESARSEMAARAHELAAALHCQIDIRDTDKDAILMYAIGDHMRKGGFCCSCLSEKRRPL